MAKTKNKKPSRTLTPRQVKAVQYLVENGGKSKAEALRAADYSPAVVNNPDRVFGSPGVQALLEEAGITPIPILQQLKRKVYSRRLDHMVFPPYREKEEQEDGNSFDDEDEGNVDILKERSEQLTDDDICTMLEELGYTVRKIVHGDMARHVYFWVENDKANLDAIEKIINLLGLYAPKKLETKNDHRVGIFSLGDLRRKMRDEGLSVTDNPHE